jgi:uncharacterized membrane protein
MINIDIYFVTGYIWNQRGVDMKTSRMALFILQGMIIFGAIYNYLETGELPISASGGNEIVLFSNVIQILVMLIPGIIGAILYARDCKKKKSKLDVDNN